MIMVRIGLFFYVQKRFLVTITRIAKLVSSSGEIFSDVTSLAIDFTVWTFHDGRLVERVRALAASEALLVEPFVASHHLFGLENLRQWL